MGLKETTLLYEQKDSYKVEDFVIINYFFIEGIVSSKSGNNYSVMYKGEDGVLQTINVPQSMLLVPTSATYVNPFVLLSD